MKADSIEGEELLDDGMEMEDDDKISEGKTWFKILSCNLHYSDFKVERGVYICSICMYGI